MAAPAAVRALADRFGLHLEDYRGGRYNETQVRREFIDPFFKCLGWDIDNEQGFAEAYKDVVHEDAIKIGGATKAPDYCFRMGGTRKFFLEAKKPSVYIKGDPAPAYQLRRYAWSAKLPLSVLTDFEEFAVYDCRVKPAPADKASAARVQYLTFDEYASKWDDIAGVFSRDAVLMGSFDKYADTAKAKKGTATVDKAFLATLSGWRVLLAQNLALRNPKLTGRELNYAVQVTLDRVIFLRMCEDRGIEFYGRLLGLVNGPKIYDRLRQFFRDADDKYNSGLFYFTKERGRADAVDALTPALTLDDKVLKEIIKGLYYPDSPYEFSVLPAEILGQVYEQFLGQVIRLTPGHQAKVEDKPEVKKAGGVYYTPTYIVEYIVRHTVGRLLGDFLPPSLEGRGRGRVEGRPRAEGEAPPRETVSTLPQPLPSREGSKGDAALSPRNAAKLRVLDPACGSGSFLLGAYQYLLDWHRDWYVADGPANHPKAIYQAAGGDWRLTVAERKRILLNNIYGVDIDPQAVEVTKLSLLLKVLEGESQDSLERQRRLFHERALPDLADNIKCGNSLIGPDFYDGQQLTMFDDEERQRINVFDWHAAFPAVMKAGGFDAVIGNPPYVRQEEITSQKGYFGARYSAFNNVSDLYVLFIEKGIRLLGPHGRFGMIVSNKWIRAGYGNTLRRFLSNGGYMSRIADFAGLPVFPNATVRTVVLLCEAQRTGAHAVVYSKPLTCQEFRKVAAGASLEKALATTEISVPATCFDADEWPLAEPGTSRLLDKLRNEAEPLDVYAGRKPFFGVKTGLNKAFIVDRNTRNRLIREHKSSAKIIHPVIAGRDIGRYSTPVTDSHIIMAYRGVDITRYPAVFAHLRQFKAELTPKKGRSDKVGRKPGAYQWYELQDAVEYWRSFLTPKIIFPDISTRCRFTFDTQRFVGTNTTYFFPSNDLYLLGILNSSLALFYFKQTCAGLESGGVTYLRFFGAYLESFPVIPSGHFRAKSKNARMVALVDEMLSVHKRLAAAKSPPDRTALEGQIAAADRQIDRLVYELYGLTEAEVKIVEGATEART